ncbi:hypothetical protein B0H13DRAFT_1897503 [Mycena leptocephala]|nr:hypothetical protein B0H13DRAFT_1897503 [Mycena leptocephala]
MSSIILTWVSSPVFSNLTTLYLGSRGFSHSVVAHSEASANKLCALFHTANCLTRLHLIWVIYSADPVVAVSFAALFYLTHLELEIYNKSLCEIVAALVLPALCTLSLIGPHYGALSQFHLECCHLLQRVDTVILEFSVGDQGDLSIVIPFLQSVSSISGRITFATRRKKFVLLPTCNQPWLTPNFTQFPATNDAPLRENTTADVAHETQRLRHRITATSTLHPFHSHCSTNQTFTGFDVDNWICQKLL